MWADGVSKQNWPSYKFAHHELSPEASNLNRLFQDCNCCAILSLSTSPSNVNNELFAWHSKMLWDIPSLRAYINILIICFFVGSSCICLMNEISFHTPILEVSLLRFCYWGHINLANMLEKLFHDLLSGQLYARLDFMFSEDWIFVSLAGQDLMIFHLCRPGNDLADVYERRHWRLPRSQPFFFFFWYL